MGDGTCGGISGSADGAAGCDLGELLEVMSIAASVAEELVGSEGVGAATADLTWPGVDMLEMACWCAFMARMA